MNYKIPIVLSLVVFTAMIVSAGIMKRQVVIPEGSPLAQPSPAAGDTGLNGLNSGATNNAGRPNGLGGSSNMGQMFSQALQGLSSGNGDVMQKFAQGLQALTGGNGGNLLQSLQGLMARGTGNNGAGNMGQGQGQGLGQGIPSQGSGNPVTGQTAAPGTREDVIQAFQGLFSQLSG